MKFDIAKVDKEFVEDRWNIIEDDDSIPLEEKWEAWTSFVDELYKENAISRSETNEFKSKKYRYV